MLIWYLDTIHIHFIIILFKVCIYGVGLIELWNFFDRPTDLSKVKCLWWSRRDRTYIWIYWESEASFLMSLVEDPVWLVWPSYLWECQEHSKTKTFPIGWTEKKFGQTCKKERTQRQSMFYTWQNYKFCNFFF